MKFLLEDELHKQLMEIEDFENFLEDESEWDSVDEEEILAIIFEYIDENGLDIIYDLVSEACSNFEITPLGLFSEIDAENIVYSSAEHYIRAHESELVFIGKIFDEQGKTINVSLLNSALLQLKNERDDSCFCARVGAYVESCLDYFVSESKWHVGAQSEDGDILDEESLCLATIDSQNNTMIFNGKMYHPCMWYGLDDEKPIKRWLIDSSLSNDELSFWFEYDTWTVLSELGDFGEVFLIWYTAECCYGAPDISDIQKECPVAFNENDSVNAIINKLFDQLRCRL